MTCTCVQVTLALCIVRIILSSVHAAGAIAWGLTGCLHVKLPRAFTIPLQSKRMRWGPDEMWGQPDPLNSSLNAAVWAVL